MVVVRLPEKLLEPVALLCKIRPVVARLPTAWTPLASSKPPANELEPVPDERNIPAVSILLVAWMPLDEVSDPENELDPAPETVSCLPMVR